MKKLSINKVPSVDKVMTYVGLLGRHEHHGDPMTGEEAHTAAAYFYAANLALRMGMLGKAWAKHRHIAAKCGELHERLCSMDVFKHANFILEVDFNFTSKLGAAKC